LCFTKGSLCRRFRPVEEECPESEFNFEGSRSTHKERVPFEDIRCIQYFYFSFFLSKTSGKASRLLVEVLPGRQTGSKGVEEKEFNIFI
jgi:hypothetical protein